MTVSARYILLALLLLLLFACSDPDALDPAAHRLQVEAWQADRLAGLTSEGGWLTLIALEWLEPGENTVRFDPRFSEGNLGTLVLEDRDGEPAVRLVPAPESGLLLNGEPAEERYLATDADRSPDILTRGELEFFVIRRENRFGIRAKHPDADAATNFSGLQYYPVDPAWRIEAEFVPYNEPRTIQVPSVIGTTSEGSVPGEVRFEVLGTKQSLLPLAGGPDDPTWFFVFRDGTSGKGTYPSGRFLVSEAAQNGRVVLDFNRAYNPPCAFTPFATCPLPPRENRLGILVEAGEKDYGEH